MQAPPFSVMSWVAKFNLVVLVALSLLPPARGAPLTWAPHLCATTPLRSLPQMGCEGNEEAPLRRILNNWETAFARNTGTSAIIPLTYSLRLSPSGFESGRVVARIRLDQEFPGQPFSPIAAGLRIAWEILEPLHAPNELFDWLRYLAVATGTELETDFPSSTSFQASAVAADAQAPPGVLLVGVALTNPDGATTEPQIDVKFYLQHSMQALGNPPLGWSVGPFRWDAIAEDLELCGPTCEEKREATVAKSLRWVLGNAASQCSLDSPNPCDLKKGSQVFYTYKDGTDLAGLQSLFQDQQGHMEPYMRVLHEALMAAISKYYVRGPQYTGMTAVQEVMVPSANAFNSAGVRASSPRDADGSEDKEEDNRYVFMPRKLDAVVNLTHPIAALQQDALEWCAFIDGMLEPACFLSSFDEMEESMVDVHGQSSPSLNVPAITTAQHRVLETIQHNGESIFLSDEVANAECSWPLTSHLYEWFLLQESDTKVSTIGVGRATDTLPFLAFYFRPPRV